jgi:hypothetical protein
MDLSTLLDRLNAPGDALEARIRELAIESDSGVDTAKAFVMKLFGEFSLILAFGGLIAGSLYFAIGLLLYDPGPLQEIIAGGGFAAALRGWCMFGPLSAPEP